MDLGSLVDGANFASNLMSLGAWLLKILPWVSIAALVFVVWNPAGYGDIAIAKVRNWFKSTGTKLEEASAKVEQTNTRLDAIEAAIRELKELVKK